MGGRSAFRTMVCITIGLGIALGGCGSTAAVPNTPTQPRISAPVTVPPPDAETPARPSEAAVQRLIQHVLSGVQDGSYADVIRVLGAPRRMTTRAVENMYAAGQVDTVRTLGYPGLQARVYVRSDDARSFLIQMRIQDAFYTAPSGLRVGMTEETVRTQQGNPQRVETGTWVYENVERSAADLRLDWEDRRLRVITYVFHFS